MWGKDFIEVLLVTPSGLDIKFKGALSGYKFKHNNRGLWGGY